MIAFKVLDHEMKSYPSGKVLWPEPPNWLEPVNNELVFGLNGYHLCTMQGLVFNIGPTIWEAEFGDAIFLGGYEVLARTARLIRQLTTWNDSIAALFTFTCIEHALKCIGPSSKVSFVFELLGMVRDLGPTKAESESVTSMRRELEKILPTTSGPEADIVLATQALTSFCSLGLPPWGGIRSALELSRLSVGKKFRSYGSESYGYYAEAAWQAEKLQQILYPGGIK